jgi:hypothetical protein
MNYWRYLYQNQNYATTVIRLSCHNMAERFTSHKMKSYCCNVQQDTIVWLSLLLAYCRNTTTSAKSYCSKPAFKQVKKTAFHILHTIMQSFQDTVNNFGNLIPLYQSFKTVMAWTELLVILSINITVVIYRFIKPSDT